MISDQVGGNSIARPFFCAIGIDGRRAAMAGPISYSAARLSDAQRSL
ncbi:hypothetical protein SJ05684_c02180 [Sinorhizobium sojae CCBAU 05684]|uniref:Uncharacterized protein n=1 Tax=Sinorhizobium sojae CCBAU 05684 TaxID=716928 RepID=A0A249P787_9HYPH|nr:hypothetical protein SJ05684_c02180 [Sinorhizobium sojae CCBAU 05684]